MFSFYERLLAVVPRWSIAPRLNPQSVAEHSFYVTLYASKLATIMRLEEPKRLQILERALRHDMVEAQTGDTPGPIKRIIVDRAKLRRLEQKFFMSLGDDYELDEADDLTRNILKAADLIDELFWISTETFMGNRLLEPQRTKVVSRLSKALARLGLIELTSTLLEECSNMARGIDFPVNDEDLA